MDARENILLIRLKSIGDILFTLPAVHAVRENFPNAKIHFLVSKEHAPILRGFADVDETITLDRACFKSGNPQRILTETFSILRRLRGGKFSLAVDFQGYGETAWLAWLSGAPQHWGNVYHRTRSWTYTRGVRRNDEIQIADWNLSLLRGNAVCARRNLQRICAARRDCPGVVRFRTAERLACAAQARIRAEFLPPRMAHKYVLVSQEGCTSNRGTTG
jgi:ADP-heptose:LPS heptosyltransferase